MEKVTRRLVEACVTRPEAVLEAARAGFCRIELCQDLSVGGVTPSPELLKAAVRLSPLPVHVLIRPRGGDFVFSEREERQMLESISLCRRLGVGGVVIGALKERGEVDMTLMGHLMDRARDASRPLSVTFHRAFDVSADPLEAFEEVLALGCDRLLTSGHAPTAIQGCQVIARLVQRAGTGLRIMAGCGVRPGNIARLEAESQAHEFHSSFISPDYWNVTE